MLTVVTPAVSNRLTTVDAVREELGLSEAAYPDEQIETMIDRASQAIIDYCGRSFGIETYRETYRGHDACGDGVLLSRSPVVSISSIDSDGDAVVLPNYEIDQSDVLYKLDANYRYPWRSAILTVVYDAGYVLPSEENGAPESTLPATIEQAVMDEIAAYISYDERDALIKSETVEGVGSTSYYVPGGSSMLSAPGSEGALARYRSTAWSVG